MRRGKMSAISPSSITSVPISSRSGQTMRALVRIVSVIGCVRAPFSQVSYFASMGWVMMLLRAQSEMRSIPLIITTIKIV